ncbi:hypothetical protein HpBT101_15400 [Helicobacter pylori]
MSSGLGFLELEKTSIFSNTRPIVGSFIETAFFGLAVILGLLFLFFGIDRNNIFLNKSLIFVFFSYNKI